MSPEKQYFMKATFKTYKADDGDCIFLCLQEGDESYVIMVDCGSYEEPIKDYVEKVLNKKIDILIVTHIDKDHIEGIEEMMTQTPDLKIGKIFFNCYQRTPDHKIITLAPAQQKRLDSIKSEVSCVIHDAIEHEVSANQAIRGLSMTILTEPNLKEKWERPYLALDARNEIPLDGWGTVKILAPTMKEIKALDEEYRSILFNELFVEEDNAEFDESESLYEMIIRYANIHSTEISEDEEVAGSDLENRLETAAEQPVKENQITPSNKASLAFVWEKGEKKVLVLGDAKPGIVINGLIKHYPHGPWPMMFEAVKVSHHGSHYNTTESLQRMIDSEHYFVTGGEEGTRPSEAALGRILLPTPKGSVKKRTLHVNYKTSLTEELEADKKLQEKYHFEIDFDQNQYEFTV